MNLTFDPSAAFETRSSEYQKSSDIHDTNAAFEAANNEDFELSGREWSQNKGEQELLDKMEIVMN